MEKVPGNVLRQFREEQEMTQTALAIRIGWSRQKLYYIERGTSIPRSDMQTIDKKLGTKWRANSSSTKSEASLMLVRILDKVNDIEARLAEIEEAQGIRHEPITRHAVKRLQN